MLTVHADTTAQLAATLDIEAKMMKGIVLDAVKWYVCLDAYLDTLSTAAVLMLLDDLEADYLSAWTMTWDRVWYAMETMPDVISHAEIPRFSMAALFASEY